MGFLVYVCGKTDPTDFFFGLRLTFDSPPHLVQLKQAIEVRAVQDNAVPDGSKYIITDLEILDLRLNMWTPLDTRAQLYSGCHVCAIRDSQTATSAGPIDIAKKLPQQRALGFALDVESAFRALDVENRGLVSLSNSLHVFRHDIGYAVEFFQLIDVRNCGQVTMQDLMSATSKKPADFWKELQLRISRGGLDPGMNQGGDFRSSGSSSASASNAATAAAGGGGGGSSRPGTPHSTAAGSGGGGVRSPLSSPGSASTSSASPRAGTPLGSKGGVRKGGIAAGILEAARKKKLEDEAEERAAAGLGGGASSPTASITAASAGGDTTGSGDILAGKSANQIGQARKVVELFQKASQPKSSPGVKGLQGAMARMKELANKKSSSGVTSNTSSSMGYSPANSPMASNTSATGSSLSGGGAVPPGARLKKQ